MFLRIDPHMTIATAPAEISTLLPLDDDLDNTVELSILRFLSGETDGEDLFDALYGDVLDEPVPAAMLELVRTGELA
jgi:hypothetical protein